MNTEYTGRSFVTDPPVKLPPVRYTESETAGASETAGGNDWVKYALIGLLVWLVIK